METTQKALGRQTSILTRLRRRLLSAAILAGWVLMPLMPVLAAAFTWWDGLS